MFIILKIIIKTEVCLCVILKLVFLYEKIFSLNNILLLKINYVCVLEFIQNFDKNISYYI